MANLQYIGARYVPKFYENSLDPSSIEWESNKNYDPLTIVTYNDDTYTSKIPVPSNIGNPASNPTYWAKTANYNAALQAITDTLSNLGETVTDLDTFTKKNIENGLSVNVFDVVNIAHYKTTLYGGDEGITYAIQGGTYNSDDDEILLFLRNGSTNVCVGVIIDGTDMKTVKRRYTYNAGDLGHVNDACYNPETGKYYVVVLDEDNPSNTNKVAVLDPSTLVIESYKQLQPVNADTYTGTWLISYDADLDQYITRSDVAIQFYDSDFNYISEIPINCHSLLKGGIFAGIDKLGVGVYNKGHYYFIDYMVDSNGDRCSFVLMDYDVKSGKLLTTNNVFTSYLNQEAEFMFIKDDIMYLVCGQWFYAVKQIILQTMPSAGDNRSLLTVPRSIPDNYDLNDLEEVGIYRIKGNYATIAHNPIYKTDSDVIVMPTASGSVLQICAKLGTPNSTICYRRLTAGSNTWSNWKDMSKLHTPDGLRDKITLNNEINAGYFSSDSKKLIFNVRIGGALDNFNSTERANIKMGGSFTCHLPGGKLMYENGSSTFAFSNTTDYKYHYNGGFDFLQVVFEKVDGTAFHDSDNNVIASDELCVVTGGLNIQYLD